MAPSSFNAPENVKEIIINGTRMITARINFVLKLTALSNYTFAKNSVLCFIALYDN